MLGGPTLAPRGSSRFQVVQAAVLASLLATGPVRRRYGAHAAHPGDEASFTLCALAVRREVMVEFDERLVCAEENELLEGLRRDGVPMRYEPSLADLPRAPSDLERVRRRRCTGTGGAGVS